MVIVVKSIGLLLLYIFNCFKIKYNLRLACGVIARSAGLFENMKKICSCSGKTLWEERELIDQQSKI